MKSEILDDHILQQICENHIGEEISSQQTSQTEHRIGKASITNKKAEIICSKEVDYFRHLKQNTHLEMCSSKLLKKDDINEYCDLFQRRMAK